MLECFNKIQYELEHAIDTHSRTLIASNNELLLNYCRRFYDRQFITRDHVHKDLLARFETLLDDYFTSDKPQALGLPSVSYCAGELVSTKCLARPRRARWPSARNEHPE